jgi:hypothetical protein
MTADNSLECRYLGWGDSNKFRQMPLADNEALIYTTPIGDAPILVRSFMDCIRSEELKERLPEQFSENDLAAVIVEMVRTLPNHLIPEFNEWFHSAKRLSADTTVIAAVISW